MNWPCGPSLLQACAALLTVHRLTYHRIRQARLSVDRLAWVQFNRLLHEAVCIEKPASR